MPPNFLISKAADHFIQFIVQQNIQPLSTGFTVNYENIIYKKQWKAIYLGLIKTLVY